MSLPKETKDRIWKDGINFSEDVKQRVSYINGATKEAERSQPLYELLKIMHDNPETWLNEEQWKELDRVLSQYNNTETKSIDASKQGQ